jgi:glycosyl transferase family 87
VSDPKPGALAPPRGGPPGASIRLLLGRLEAATRRAAVSRRIALGALGLLAIVYVGLAALVAAPGSAVVLAAAERSPDWLLGPWQPFGLDGARGELAGPLYYAGLWLAMLSYCAVLLAARAVGPRLAIGSIVALHLLFLLAPPLLSQDVFSYISYARLEVVHSLSPYTHSPDAVPGDAAFAFAGSKDATSVYGPLFTLATYPLAKLSVPAAFWTLKGVAALASLGVVALSWACARRLARDPVPVALAVGLNPLVLVHAVGGAHNDGLVVLLWMAATLAVLGVADASGQLRPLGAGEQRAGLRTTRDGLAGFLGGAATGIKVSAGLVLPFLALGARRRAALIAGAAGAALLIGAASLAAFGLDALDALGLIGENQERTSRWSLPQRSADGIAALSGASAQQIVDYTRAAFGALFIGVVLVLLRRTWRAPRGSSDWLVATGWATLALLVASAWLVPWYAIWLLPLAALSGSGRLMAGSLALCAYMLVIAVPL